MAKTLIERIKAVKDAINAKYSYVPPEQATAGDRAVEAVADVVKDTLTPQGQEIVGLYARVEGMVVRDAEGEARQLLEDTLKNELGATPDTVTGVITSINTAIRTAVRRSA